MFAILLSSHFSTIRLRQRDRLDDKVRLGNAKQASHFINALPI
ncbi:MAG: hypothetical protein ACR2LR_02260 [Hassallia sp.]